MRTYRLPLAAFCLTAATGFACAAAQTGLSSEGKRPLVLADVLGTWSTNAKPFEKNPVELGVTKDHKFLMGRMYPVRGVVEEHKGRLFLRVNGISGGATLEEGLEYLAAAPEGKMLSLAKLKKPIRVFLSNDGKRLTIEWCPAAPEIAKIVFFRVKYKLAPR